MIRFCFLSLLIPAWFFSAQAQNRTQIYEEYKVKIHQLHINVVDKQGHPVRDLTESDFEILLNGEAQPIDSITPISLLRDVVGADVEENESAAPIPEHGRRLFIFLFDLQFNSFRGLFHARNAAKAFVENDLLETDLAGVFIFGRDAIHMVVNFTNDRDQLQWAIETLGMTGQSRVFQNNSGYIAPELIRQTRVRSFSDDLDLVRGSLGGGEFGSVEQSLRNLMAGQAFRYLQTFEKFGGSLSFLKGRKNLFYFTEGFDGDLVVGPNRSSWVLRHMDDLIESLQASGTVVYSVDTSRVMAQSQKTSLDLLNNISESTGGRIYTNYNRFRKPLEKVEAVTSDYYLVNIRTELDLPVGEIARVKVNVKRPGVKVYAPKGLLLNPDFGKSSDLERKLLLSEYISKDQIALPIPITMETVQVPTSSGQIKVSAILDISGYYFLDNASGTEPQEFEVFTIAIEKNGGTLAAEQYMTFNLEPLKIEKMLERTGVKYFTNLYLEPGRYKIKTIVRNLENGHIACMIRDLDLFTPNLALSQPIPLAKDHWFILERQDDSEQPGSGSPYRFGSIRLVPSAAATINPGGKTQFLYLVDPAQLLGREDQISVAAIFSDAKGAATVPPPGAVTSRIVQGGPNETRAALILEIDFSSVTLARDEAYQLLTRVTMGDMEPIRGIYNFNTE